MADALKFMIEFIDRVTKPASNAARAVGNLDAQLLKIRNTVSEVASLPAVKFPTPKITGAKTPAVRSVRDSLATGAMDMGGAKMAKEAARLIAAAKREEVRVAKAAERAKLAEARAAERARIQAARDAQKQLAQVAKANEMQAKAAQKAQLKAAKDAARAQKALGGTGRSMASIAKADRAHEFVEKFAGSLGLLVHPAVLAAAAVTLLGAGLAKLVLGGLNLALEAEAAKSDTLDMLEAALGTASAAADAYANIKGIATELGVSQEGLKTTAQELTAAGIENAALLNSALRSIATANTVVKGSGDRVKALIERSLANDSFTVSARQLSGTGIKISQIYEEIAKRTGKGVKEVEAEMKAGKIAAETGIAALSTIIDKRFGKIALDRAGGFAESVQRFRDGFKGLFEDVNVKAFEAAFFGIAKFFDQSTASGKALKHVVTTIFDGLFKAASAVLPYVETLLLGLVLIALKLWNAFRPVAAAIAKAFGGDAEGQALSFADAMLLVANTIGFVANGIAAVLKNKMMIDGIVASVRLFAFAVKTLAGMLGLVMLGIGAVLAAGALLQVWLVSLAAKAHEAATNFVSGLVNGIASGAGKVVGAVKNLGESAVSTFKNFFGMRSPSRLMAGLGENLTQGLSMGVDRGAKAANDNMANVVDLQAVRARGEQAANAAPSQGGAGRSVSIEVNFTEGAIQINGSNMSVAEVRELFPEVLVDAIERALLSQGGGEKVA